MSSQASVPPPFQQWQQFFPSSAGSYPYGADPLHEQIYAAVTGNAEATRQQFANDIGRDTLRAIDQNAQSNMTTTERTAAQLSSAIERNGSMGMNTTERVNNQLASAVERNGANNYAAIERVAGESRMTTVVTDAASRQYSNDSARDTLKAIDRVEVNTVGLVKDTYTGLLASIERNAGESRLATISSAGQTDSRLTDTRHSILSEVNKGTADLLNTMRANSQDLATAVHSGAWENRTAMAAGFNQAMVEQLKSAGVLALQGAQDTAHVIANQQSLNNCLIGRMDGQFTSTQIEMQKVKEGLATQAAYNYSVGQLESQKIKEGLAQQASTHFAINQLEQQKVKESLSMQLAEAKYEALKSQQYLTDKMSECCCEVKEKIDNVDRDRLRDNLTVSKEETNLFKLMEIGALGGFGGRRGGDRGDGRRR